MPLIGLIVNDGKPLAVQTADAIQQKLAEAGHQVIRASSSLALRHPRFSEASLQDCAASTLTNETPESVASTVTGNV